MFAHAQTKNSGVSGRNVMSRSARGPVSFVDVSLDGSYITIENTTTGSKAKSVQLDGWTLRKKRKKQPDILYKFGDYILHPGVKLRVSSGRTPCLSERMNVVFRRHQQYSSYIAIVCKHTTPNGPLKTIYVKRKFQSTSLQKAKSTVAVAHLRSDKTSVVTTSSITTFSTGDSARLPCISIMTKRKKRLH